MINSIVPESLGLILVPRKDLEELYKAVYFKKACEECGIAEWEKYSAVIQLCEKYAEEDIDGGAERTE